MFLSIIFNGSSENLTMLWPRKSDGNAGNQWFLMSSVKNVLRTVGQARESAVES